MNLNFVASWTNGKYHFAQSFSEPANINFLSIARKIEKMYEKDGWRADFALLVESKRKADEIARDWNESWQNDGRYDMPIGGKVYTGKGYAGEEQEESYRNKRRAVKENKKMRRISKRRAYKESTVRRTRKPLRESIMVEVDEDEFLDMLLDRLKTWTTDYRDLTLYEEMYQNYIDAGVFDTVHEGIAVIVDNDWVNYCTILTEDDRKYDDRYDECVELIEEGEREGDNFTIEAYLGDKDTGYAILIRTA